MSKMVSVIVPVYNVGDYIGRCVESVIGQTYKNIEIILVDDGSTDNAGLICDEYAGHDSRIRVIHKPNGGLVSARKAGLEEARGEYVACVDGDDWMEIDAIEKALEIGKNADVLCFAAVEEYENGEYGTKRNTVKEGLYSGKEALSALYGSMLMNGNFFEMGVLPYQWGKMVRTDLLRQCQAGVPDGISYAEDVACVYPYLLKAKSVFVSNLCLYHYRVRSNSMVNKMVELDKLQDVFKVLQEAFESVGLEQKETGAADSISADVAIKEKLLRQLEYYKWQSMLLKSYWNIKGDMCLMPFANVKLGMRVAVYGAGLFGQVIHQYCGEKEGLLVAGWFDQKYERFQLQGMNVQPSTAVLEMEFDILVIAILNVRLARQIKEDFVRQGVPQEKIDYVDTSIFLSNL